MQVLQDKSRDIALGIGQRPQDVQIAFERRSAKGRGLDNVLLRKHLFRRGAIHRARPH